MSVNIRYPNITAGTEKEQITQIKSYLHQLVEHLNYALPTLGTGGGTSQGTSSFFVQGSEMSYYELRSLIIQELQEVEQLFDKLEAEVLKSFDDLESDILRAKEAGEFDGYTPVKGLDYFTEVEIDGVARQAAGKISFTLDDDGNLYYELEE